MTGINITFLTCWTKMLLLPPQVPHFLKVTVKKRKEKEHHPAQYMTLDQCPKKNCGCHEFSLKNTLPLSNEAVMKDQLSIRWRLLTPWVDSWDFQGGRKMADVIREKGIPSHISCKEETSFSRLHGNIYQIKTVYFQSERCRLNKSSFLSHPSLWNHPLAKMTCGP